MSRILTYTESLVMITEACCDCGVIFAMTQEFRDEKKKRRDDPEARRFYCPNGHGQCYSGKTDAQIEREKRQIAEKNAAFWQERARAEEAAKNALEKRVGNGICPCCSRTFKQVARHLRMKHPDYHPPASATAIHAHINEKPR